jgi:cytochrome c553
MKRANLITLLGSGAAAIAVAAACFTVTAADAPKSSDNAKTPPAPAAAPATANAPAAATAPAPAPAAATAPAPAVGTAPAAAAPAAAAPAAAPAAEAKPAASSKPDPAKGQQIASGVCAACHAADGNSVMPANPKLAGQNADYLVKQLMNFEPQNGKPPERNSPVMMGIASTLTSADDMRNVAAFFSSQQPKPGAAQNKATLAMGQKLYRGGNPATGVPACAGCHGPAGAGIPAQYPRLSGQYADYTSAQLAAFRSGDRANDPNSMMRTIAARMSDQEIKAVADYVAGLH